MADINVKGLSELQKVLDAFPVKIEKNILRGALRAGAKVVQQEAKSNARVLSGEMQRGIKIGTTAKRGTVIASVKVRGKHWYLAQFHEFGTKRGVLARPFMRPALDSQAQAAVVASGEYIKKRLDKKYGLDASYIMVEGDE